MSLLAQVTTAREVIPNEALPPVRMNIQGRMVLVSLRSVQVRPTQSSYRRRMD